VPGIDELPSGSPNPVQMVYSNASLSAYPETVEGVNNKNAYRTAFKADW